MISKKMAVALNEQIGHELFSSNLYLSMSAWAEDANLPGFGKWLRAQAEEERTHAMKFFDYVLDQGEKPVIPAFEKPADKFASILDVFRQVLEHEKKVTALIHKLQASPSRKTTGRPRPNWRGSSRNRSRKRRTRVCSSPTSKWSATRARPS